MGISRPTLIFGSIFLIVGFIALDFRHIYGTGHRISGPAFNELANEVLSSPVAEHWWPTWAKDGAFADRELATVSGRSVEVTQWESERRNFVVDAGAAGDLRVATFYYPFWRASVNGRIVAVGKDANGSILIPIDDGRSEVVLYFEEPASHRIARWISGVTWILLLLGFAYRIGMRDRR